MFLYLGFHPYPVVRMYTVKPPAVSFVELLAAKTKYGEAAVINTSFAFTDIPFPESGIGFIEPLSMTPFSINNSAAARLIPPKENHPP
jgi:hypothetical protein